MTQVILLLTMIFFHVVDDYYLQGILASMKQKDWWHKNEPSDLYKFDYVAALSAHAFSWTFMIHLPILLCTISRGFWFNTYEFAAAFAINFIIHVITDDQKANRHTINLLLDQMIHIAQIVLSWAYYITI